MIWPKRKRWKYEPPAPPPNSSLNEARREARRASRQLESAEAQQDEITERIAPLEEALVSNNLGPKFWAAVAARRRPT